MGPIRHAGYRPPRVSFVGQKWAKEMMMMRRMTMMVMVMVMMVVVVVKRNFLCICVQLCPQLPILSLSYPLSAPPNVTIWPKKSRHCTAASEHNTLLSNRLHTIQYSPPNVTVWPKKSQQCSTMQLKTLQCSVPEPITLRPPNVTIWPKKSKLTVYIVLHCSVHSELHCALGCSYILKMGFELMPARTACPTITISPPKNFRHIS